MPTNLTDADLAAIEARLHAAQGSLKAFGPNAVDVWTQIDDLAALFAALRTAWAERDEARSQSERAHSRAENAIAARRVTLAQRDEARALVKRLAVDDPVYYAGRDADEPRCYWCDNELNIHREEQHAPNCAWQTAREAVEAWKGSRDE